MVRSRAQQLRGSDRRARGGLLLRRLSCAMLGRFRPTYKATTCPNAIADATDWRLLVSTVYRSRRPGHWRCNARTRRAVTGDPRAAGAEDTDPRGRPRMGVVTQDRVPVR